jgi:hypothetical protein
MIRSTFAAARRWRLRASFAVALGVLAACSDSTGNQDTAGPPEITGLSPASAAIGGGDQPITVNGKHFTASSVVSFDGLVLPTTFVSGKQLTVTYPGVYADQPRVLQVRVITQAEPNAGTSAPVSFSTTYPSPALTALSTDTASAGRADVVVAATGTGFTAASKVRWNGVEVPTTYGSATQLVFVLGPTQLAAAGTSTVTVFNPAPGGGASAGRSFTVSKPVPVITVLPSAGATAGRPGFTLTLHGVGFMQGSSVEWNGAPRAASYLSGSRLEVPVSSADVAAPGTVTLRVVNPGVATPSNATTLTIRTLPAATTTVTRVSIPGVRDLAWDAPTNRLYVSVRSSGGALGNTVTRVDPVSGALDGSIFVGSEPGHLARSDDGQYLYVGLDGASGVRRVHLPTFTAGLQWSLDPGQVAGDLAVMPGAPGTVAVSRQRPGYSPPLDGVTVYDNGVARPTSSPGHTGGNRIEFLDRPDALYGFNNAHTGFEFFTIGIDAAGARHLTTNGGLVAGFYTDIVGAAGRIYGTDGSVVDPERRVKLGSFGGGSPVAVDPATGRIFAPRDGGLQVYDANTFQLLATLPWPAGVSFNLYDGTAKMLRVGTDGLAFVDEDELIIIRGPMIGP